MIIIRTEIRINSTFRWIYLLLALLLAPGVHAQKQEIGLTLGGISGSGHLSQAGPLDLGSDVAFEGSYAYRLLGDRAVSLSAELNVVASPNRRVSSEIPNVTHDFASLYVTPGIQVKFLPAGRIAPFVVLGGGYALYEQSKKTEDGQVNPAPRYINRGVFDYGGGADFRVFPFAGLRVEVRDFYSGNPAFNAPVKESGQHNVVATGGIVLRF